MPEAAERVRRLRWVGRVSSPPLCAPHVGCTLPPVQQEDADAARFRCGDFALRLHPELGEGGLWVVTLLGGKVGFAPTFPDALAMVARLHMEREADPCTP